MRRGTPNQFIAELESKIADLKGGDIESSAQVIDDGEDVIQADDFIEDVVEGPEDTEVVEEEISEETPAEEEANEKLIVDPDPESDTEGHAEYLTGLYRDVENELADLAQSIAWSSDEDNVYMDISFADGHVFTFTIPKADLAYDIENKGTDIEYICQAVFDSADLPEESFDDVTPEDANYDMSDYYAEEDKPVYL